MPADETIYEKHYNAYLDQIKGVHLESTAVQLGAEVKGEALTIALLNKKFTVSRQGIAGPDGRTPSYDTCVILCKYILLCPQSTPQRSEWVGYREFKDSGPLISYFANAVEGAAASRFTGKLSRLTAAARRLGAYPPGLDIRYDLACQFDVLPKVPLMLLFNDADEEFSGTCSLLFERRAEDYLDAECLAMVGHHLVRRLGKGL
jgi:hypothetical protein